MKKLRILLLMNARNAPPGSIENLDEKEVHKFKAEWDVTQALQVMGHEVISVPVQEELVTIRRAIEEHRPHVAFNLLVGFMGVGLYDAHVVSFLELLKMPYTGVNPRGIMLSSDKPLSKKVLSYHRIRIPHFTTFRLRRKRISKPDRLNFPLIVKSSSEHSSLGIAQASIARDDTSLRDRVLFIHEYIGTDAIVEEYIEGREITIGVLGNQRLETFPVWEMFFDKLPEGSENIATSKIKWDLDYQEKIGIRTGPALDLSTEKQAEIAKLAKRIYRVLGMSGYARIDLRMDKDGRIFVIEANPNPDISMDEDYAVSALSKGMDYEPLLQKIINLGIAHRPAWKER